MLAAPVVGLDRGGSPLMQARTVSAADPAAVLLTPSVVRAAVGDLVPLAARVLDARGGSVSGAGVTWRSVDEKVATVDARGVVTTIAAGTARIEGRLGRLADTAVVAVVGPRTLLSTAIAGGRFVAEVRPGQEFEVPVTLDLSRVSRVGDLGAVEFRLGFDPRVLRLVAAEAGVKGSAETYDPTPGEVRFAFAGTSAQGSAELVLATLRFRVAEGVSAGTRSAFELSYATAPSSTSFQSYEMPVNVSGRVVVRP